MAQGWCRGGARVVQGRCKGGARVVQGRCKGGARRGRLGPMPPHLPEPGLGDTVWHGKTMSQVNPGSNPIIRGGAELEARAQPATAQPEIPVGAWIG